MPGVWGPDGSDDKGEGGNSATGKSSKKNSGLKEKGVAMKSSRQRRKSGKKTTGKNSRRMTPRQIKEVIRQDGPLQGSLYAVLLGSRPVVEKGREVMKR